MNGPNAPAPKPRLYVLFNYPQRSQTFVRNEIVGLRERGIEVDVLSVEPSADAGRLEPSWSGPYRVLGQRSPSGALVDHLFFVMRHPRRYGRFLVSLGHLREHWRVALRRLPGEARALLARPNPPGGCHTHFAWPSASIGSYLAILLGVPASITVHANDIYVGDPRPLGRRLRWFDDLVTVCNFNVGLLAGRGFTSVGSDRVSVVPCGVDVPRSPATPQQDGGIVCVGRLVPKKGFDVFLRALASVPADLPGASAVIAGSGPEETHLRALAVELGIGHRVRFLGAVDHETSLGLIASAAVFCLPSRRAPDGDCDAVPVVLREALVRGVPVISTTLTGIPETVDSDSGWLVAPGDANELAAAIGAALSDTDERRRRGAHGRKRVAEQWTLDHQVSGIASVFARADARRAMTTAEPR